MKKALFFILICTQFSYAQIMNSVYPNIPYSEIEEIAADGDYIYTSGDCAVSLVSNNGGQDWTTIEFDETVAQIEIVPGSNGTQAFYLTRDQLFMLDYATLSFTEVTDASLTLQTGFLRDVLVRNDMVYLVGNTVAFQSPVGDYDWTKLGDFNFQEVNSFRRSSDITESKLFVGSNDGDIISLDLATGTHTALSNFGGSISKIEMINDDLGYVSASGQTSILKTEDGGQNWSSLSNMPENIDPVAFGENVILTVNTNRIYVSTDGGQSVTHIPASNDGYVDLIFASYMTDAGELYMAGRSSVVLKSTDFGFNFSNLNRYKRAAFTGLKINAQNLGYAVGNGNSIIKTENGGIDWSPIDLGINSELYTNGLALFDDGRIVIGTDDGVKIFENETLVIEVDLPVNNLFQPSSGDALIALVTVGGGNALSVSTDRGETWETKAMVPVSYTRFHQSKTGKIYVPSGAEDVFVSTDMGQTWGIENYGLSNISEVSFLDDQRGLIVSNGDLFKTDNGGANALQIANDFAISHIRYFNEDQILFTTPQNSMTTVKESSNGGDNFLIKSVFCSRTNATFYDGNQTIWLAQNGGHINKHVFETLTSTSSVLPLNSFSVHPNPASDGQRIHINAEITGETKIRLTELSGKVAFESSIQTNDKHFTLPRISSGYYVISMENENERWLSKLIIQ